MARDPQENADLIASASAIAFTKRSFVFDCLSLYYVLDEPYAERCLEGGVNAANVTFATETESWDETLRKIETGLDKIARNPNLKHATSTADLLAAQKEGKLAVVVGTQGATMIEDKLWRVEILHRLGVRYLGLAYTGANLFGDGCGELRNAGVSFLGRELIEVVNGLGMLLDLSHCGHQTRWDAAQLAKNPVCTHSNSYTVNPNDRNTKDETVVEIAKKGGIIGVCGLARSVRTENPTIEDMLDHADHFVKLVGHEHVGLGFDFVEAYVEARHAGTGTHKPPKWRVLRPDIFGTVEDFFTVSYPRGMHSIRLLPNFTQGLFDRGYTEDQVAAILGGNWLRNFEAVVG